MQYRLMNDEVLQQLLNYICSNRVEIGDKLPGETTLSKMLNVSRTRIREALKVLVFSGVVETKPGIGTFVIKKTIASATKNTFEELLKNTPYSNLLEVRRLLEGQSAYWAAERASDEELNELTAILENFGNLPLNALHKCFHTKVAELSKNPVFIHLISLLENQYAGQREINFMVLPDEDRHEHWRLLEAIKSKNPARAKQAMEDHVDFLWKKVKLT